MNRRAFFRFLAAAPVAAIAPETSADPALATSQRAFDTLHVEIARAEQELLWRRVDAILYRSLHDRTPLVIPGILHGMNLGSDRD